MDNADSINHAQKFVLAAAIFSAVLLLSVVPSAAWFIWPAEDAGGGDPPRAPEDDYSVP